ncbi:MAG TPA: protein-glutamate O-methyltransferase CheR [Gemmatimonadaceae bacterium]|nr:protein-glutamate O-methyltransferase CheR [Gemmatimonadaceae bacterium]
MTSLLAHVQQRTGLEIPAHRVASCEPAIRRAMAHASVHDLAHLQDVLDTDPRAFDALVDALTIGETYFLRDPRQLAFLRGQAIPDLLHHRSPDHVLSVWSAGCASGEEAYSLSILLHELGLGDRRRILGTDLSRRRLAAAKRGRYGKWSLRGVAPAMVNRYFQPCGSGFEIVPLIRSAVRFEYLNLGAEFGALLGAGGFDLIVCRNVLIYFDSDTVARVSRALVERLSEGGWLLLGPSDPPLPDTPSCEVVITDAGLAYHRTGQRARVPRPASLRPASLDVTETASSSSPSVAPMPASDARWTAPPVPRSVPAAAPEASSARALAELLAEAKRSLAAREYGATVDQVRSYLQRGGTDEDGWVSLVRALSNCGRASEAALSCAAALEAHPVSAELMVLNSFLLTELGQHNAALAAARGALFLDRALVVAHLALASALLRTGDRRGARRAFTNAINLLKPLEPDAPVRASGGEPAARLLQLARSQLQLLGEQSR